MEFSSRSIYLGLVSYLLQVNNIFFTLNAKLCTLLYAIYF